VKHHSRTVTGAAILCYNKFMSSTQRSSTAKKQIRDSLGQFIKQDKSIESNKLKSSKNIPPLLSFEVNNPVTYLKLWWKKIMGNEGIDFRFRIRPLTAVALVLIFSLGGFGLGRFTLPANSVITKYVPQLAPAPSPDPWKETAYTGLLKQTSGRFYLVTSEAEAITLELPNNVNLTKYLGKRILAVGRFNKSTLIMQVTDASDLEVLIQSVPVPVTSPVPTPSASPAL